MANLPARHATGGYFTNRCCYMGRSPGLQTGLLDVWTIFKVNLSKISISSKNSGHKKLIHTTNDIPLPHHPSTLGQVIHPTLALSSPTWDPGERPYDHGSSWPHPLPSKHKDDEIWDEFQDISLSHLDSCWCAVECSPNVQVSLSQPTLAW